jgi:glucosamine-6-phosphate deaminase
VDVYATPDELGEALAGHVADLIAAANRADQPFVLGCPGGRSPVTTYRALAAAAAGRKLDLGRLIIAMMDEYVIAASPAFVACDSAAHYSCRRFARERIQAVLNRRLPAERRLPEANIWMPDPARPEDYDRRLERAGGIDLFILASGASDGHVAFNPPGTSLSSRTRVVKLAQTTRRDNLATFPDFTDLREVPTHGVTVGLGTICDLSREAVLILHGPDKRAAASLLLLHNGFDEVWPASCIFAAAKGRILLDQAAAEGLDDDIARRPAGLKAR